MTETVTPVLPPDETPAESSDPLAGTLLIVGSIALTIVLGGAFLITLEALRALKISVPPDVATSMGDQIVKSIESTIDKLEKRVTDTINPYDDAALAIGRLPIEAVVEAIKKRGLDKEYLASLGQGHGSPQDTAFTDRQD